MGKDRFTEHAQNQLGCEKCNIWQTFLSDQNSAAIIEGLMLVFHCHGYPLYLCSDAAPNLSSKEMDTFCQENVIEQIFSSPYHPQSNGMAKATVKIVKTLYKKMEGDSVAFSEALLGYHDMPVGPNLPILAQHMTGHCLNSDLPAVSQSDKGETKVEARYGHKRWYLQGPGLNTEYNIRNLVWMQNPISKLWSEGTIIGLTMSKDSNVVSNNSDN